MMKEPQHIVIFGRAIGLKHLEGRDDATKADIERRAWKKHWPHYMRVHHADFLAGTFASGVSLNAMMEELGAYAFAPTKRNFKRGKGNINPRKAYNQQAAVELSEEGDGLDA
jgi:hypothetical protein